MEATEEAAWAAVSLAKAAAAAKAKDAAAAVATAKELKAAEKEAAVAASAKAKDAAAAEAIARELKAAEKEATVAASAAMLKSKEAVETASAKALDAKEAAAVAATLEEAAATVTATVQASKKRKFHLIVHDQDPPESGNVHGGDIVDDQNDPPGSGNVDGQDLFTRLPDAVMDFELRSKDHRTAGETAAAAESSKRRKFHLDEDPPKSENFDDEDFISRLHNKALCIIVSLLPTKEAARTQVISRRWRLVWRCAPLNLVADREFKSKDHTTFDLIPKILFEHRGPARCFSLCLSFGDCYDKMEGWLSSPALDNLQELELTNDRYYCYGEKLYPLPLSAYRFAPTLRFAKFCGCHFPNLIVPLSLQFPCLKQLTLHSVTISEDALQSIFSVCPSLESLELKDNVGTGRLSISCKSLKSLGFSADRRKGGVFLHELVIEDAPCLERLLPLDPENGPASIRIISAPKLKILGVLSDNIPELHFGTNVFQKMIVVGLRTKMYTVRVLALESGGPNLDLVVNFLKCFPCLERLYVSFQLWMVTNNVQKYDPLDPIECLQLHLKKVVLKNYDGLKKNSIDFAKFFVLNAKVLKEMKIRLPYHRQDKWFANQHWLLQTKYRASRGARIELTCGSGYKEYLTHNSHTHDLSMTDPFDMPSRGCSKCWEFFSEKESMAPDSLFKRRGYPF